jgi:hypothetical protein
MILGRVDIFRVRLESYDGGNMIGKYVNSDTSTKLNQAVSNRKLTMQPCGLN